MIIVFEHNVLDGVESGLTTLSGGKGLLLLDVGPDHSSDVTVLLSGPAYGPTGTRNFIV